MQDYLGKFDVLKNHFLALYCSPIVILIVTLLCVGRDHFDEFPLIISTLTH